MIVIFLIPVFETAWEYYTENKKKKMNYEEDQFQIALLNNGRFIILMNMNGSWTHVYYNEFKKSWLATHDYDYHSIEACKLVIQESLINQHREDFEKQKSKWYKPEDKSIKKRYEVKTTTNINYAKDDIEIWNDPEMIKLFNQMISTTNEEKLDEIMKQIQERKNLLTKI
jgi:hypothetical protein